MKTRVLSICVLGLALTVSADLAAAEKSRPTCEEEPGLRDCVKVEDPDASAPAPSVYRQKKPVHPIARPASGGATGK